MHLPSPTRYDNPSFYRRCGRSGLKLPVISLGLWHNFGGVDALQSGRAMACRAFDLGVTHFDLANNYGPPPGSAEETFGRILRTDLGTHRDELIVSTKAGYDMWLGPYGNFGSRKYLLTSLDQSLQRMGLAYVDIFYHHRPDPETPLEETMGALAHAVKSGKALYVGISNYGASDAARAITILRSMGTPCLIHQPSYSMFDRKIEPEVLPLLTREGVGCIAFSPLARGLLTNRYFDGIPADSRAGHDPRFLRPAQVTDAVLAKTKALDSIAKTRGQTLAQLAISWVLRDPTMTSALVGVSKVSQVEDCVAASKNLAFRTEELATIDTILAN